VQKNAGPFYSRAQALSSGHGSKQKKRAFARFPHHKFASIKPYLVFTEKFEGTHYR
jgi:hypothetical protein